MMTSTDKIVEDLESDDHNNQQKDISAFTPPVSASQTKNNMETVEEHCCWENTPHIFPPIGNVTAKLTDLDSDTTLLVITFLEKHDVLALSETCQHFTDETSRNAIWNHFLTEEQLLPVYNRYVRDDLETYGNNDSSSVVLAVSHWSSMIEWRSLTADIVELPRSFVQSMYERQVVKQRTNIKQQYAQLSSKRIYNRCQRLLENDYLLKQRAQRTISPRSRAFMWLGYSLLFLISMLYFLIMFPLCLDKTIPSERYIWLVPYLPPALTITGFYLVFLCIEIWKANFIPYVVTRRQIDILCDVIRAKTLEQVESYEKVLRVNDPTLSMISSLLFVPTFIILCGVKVGLFWTTPEFKWIYVIIPTIVVQWVSLVSSLFHTCAAWIRSHTKTYLFVAISSTIVAILLSAAMILNALKADNYLPSTVLYSHVFILYYVVILLIPVMIIVCVISYWRTVIQDFFCALFVTTVAGSVIFALVSSGIISTLVLNGRLLDNKLSIPFIAAFAPAYAVFASAISLLMCATGCVIRYGGRTDHYFTAL